MKNIKKSIDNKIRYYLRKQNLTKEERRKIMKTLQNTNYTLEISKYNAIFKAYKINTKLYIQLGTTIKEVV